MVGGELSRQHHGSTSILAVMEDAVEYVLIGAGLPRTGTFSTFTGAISLQYLHVVVTRSILFFLKGGQRFLLNQGSQVKGEGGQTYTIALHQHIFNVHDLLKTKFNLEWKGTYSDGLVDLFCRLGFV